MKYYIFVFSMFANMAFACGVSDAKVTSTHRYHDGNIFVNFDKETDCNCSQKKRLAFREDDPNLGYVKSMVLMAYASQVEISASSNSENCTVHGNTAVLTSFTLNRQ